MKLTSTTKRVAVGLLAAALPLSMAACSKGASSSTGGAGGELTMWTHNAGNKAELAAITNIVNDYNASQKKYKVKVQIEGDQLRVFSASRDELQKVIAYVKGNDYGIPLQFTNYR
jgi:uncharacterized protein YajQ (UPF0234 family)